MVEVYSTGNSPAQPGGLRPVFSVGEEGLDLLDHALRRRMVWQRYVVAVLERHEPRALDPDRHLPARL